MDTSEPSALGKVAVLVNVRPGRSCYLGVAQFSIAGGLGNGDITRKLVVTDTAVSKHIGNIFAKLGLS
ncbi:hypothetical protein [Rhodococcus sp. WMMA185]|uniref:hypothetical protein n=1 Tax=Rhodococcus sp. WMMA185 TaxID=679318 RepID=UPI003FA7C705